MGLKGSKNKLPKEDLDCLMSKTNYDEASIKEWYKGFQRDCPDGKLTLTSFTNIYSQCFVANENDDDFYRHVFRTFDSDRNEYIDFTEFLLAMDVLYNGSPEQKLIWIFGIYDVDGNGTIDLDEMTTVLKSINDMMGYTRPSGHLEAKREGSNQTTNYMEVQAQGNIQTTRHMEAQVDGSNQATNYMEEQDQGTIQTTGHMEAQAEGSMGSTSYMEAQAQKIFQLMDVNSNGRVTQEEFVRCCLQYPSSLVPSFLPVNSSIQSSLSPVTASMPSSMTPENTSMTSSIVPVPSPMPSPLMSVCTSMPPNPNNDTNSLQLSFRKKSLCSYSRAY